VNISIPVGYIPLRYSEREVPLHLPVPWLYRLRLKWIYPIFSIFGQTSPLPVQNLPRYELVAWPTFIVRFRLCSGKEKMQETFIAVDAWSKTTARFERMRDVHENPEINYHLIVEPNISLDEVKQIAEYNLMQQLLRQRGMKITPDEVTSDVYQLVYTPIWACYFPRTFYSLDVRLLDGYSGEKLGPQIRSAFLNALIYQKFGS